MIFFKEVEVADGASQVEGDAKCSFGDVEGDELHGRELGEVGVNHFEL